MSNKKELSSSVQKTSGPALIKSDLCDSRVAIHNNLASLGPCLQGKGPSHRPRICFLDSLLNPLNGEGFLPSHRVQSLDKVLSSCFPSPLYLNKNSFLLKKYSFQEIMNSNCHGPVRDPRVTQTSICQYSKIPDMEVHGSGRGK